MRGWYLFVALCAAVLAKPACGFEPSDRWNNTATNGSTGSQGTPVTLTWGLVADGTVVDNGTGSDLIAMLDFEFGAGPGGSDYTRRPWFPIFTDAFTRLGDLAGLDFVYEPSDDGASFSSSNFGVLGTRADARIGGRTYGSGSSTLASNFFPDYAEMMINTDRGDFFDGTSNNFRALRNTLMHEALHGVGLSHVDADSPGFLMEPSITTAFDGPQLDDILGMQRLYGDVFEKSGGNDVYSSAVSLGLVTESQAGIIGQNGNVLSVTAADADFVSIDDNSDVDFFSFTLDAVQNVSLELRPQGAAYETGPQDGTVELIDTRALSDLTLTLFSSNGVTELGTSNAGGLGQTETIAMSLGPGAYYARVSGAQDDIQLYQLSVAVAGNPESLTWTGLVNNTWDLLTTANFDNGSGAEVFANLDGVTFDDSGQEQTVSLVGSLNPASVTISGSADYTFTGSGALTSGSLLIDTTGTVEFTNSGNTYAGPTDVNQGTLILSGDTTAMISDFTIADGAMLIMDSDPAGGNRSTFLVEPGGTLQIGRLSPNSSADVFPNNPISLVNNGTIRIVDFESVTNISGLGDVIVAEELALLGGNSYSGQTIVEAGGGVQMTDDSAFGNTTGNTIVEAGGYVIARNDSFGPDSVVIFESFELAGSGDGPGALQVAENTTATFHGGWTVAAEGATIRVSGTSSLVMNGAVNGLAGQTTASVAAGSSLQFNGNVTIGAGGLLKDSPGTATFTGAISVDGPLNVTQGAVELDGSGSVRSSVRVAGGATLGLGGTTTFSAAASLTGRGTVDGDLNMPGQIAPGDNGIGALQIDGSLLLVDSSVLTIDIGGVGIDEYDRIDVAGTAQLDGTLAVDLIDLGSGVYQPQLGDSFGLFAVIGGAGGTFEHFQLPALSPGLDWRLNPGGITVFLEVIAADGSDFDLDGDTDGFDFLALQRDTPALLEAWQGDFGDVNPPTAVAAGGDFLTRQRDDPALLESWQGSYGSDNPSLAVVPEPTTATGVLVMAAGLLGGGRRRS